MENCSECLVRFNRVRTSAELIPPAEVLVTPTRLAMTAFVTLCESERNLATLRLRGVEDKKAIDEAIRETRIWRDNYIAALADAAADHDLPPSKICHAGGQLFRGRVA